MGAQTGSGCAQLANALGDALLSEVEAGQLYGEALTAHLAREAEATRMLRIVVRLAQVLERPEGDLDPQWAETGAPVPQWPITCLARFRKCHGKFLNQCPPPLPCCGRPS